MLLDHFERLNTYFDFESLENEKCPNRSNFSLSFKTARQEMPLWKLHPNIEKHLLSMNAYIGGVRSKTFLCFHYLTA